MHSAVSPAATERLARTELWAVVLSKLPDASAVATAHVWNEVRRVVRKLRSNEPSASDATGATNGNAAGE